ncbi:hypothetical protein AYR47_22205 [Pseudomonas azotoformans]|uniref:Uncharacterized protein n=1 Tax=Pseudomonas azotoformans TaxID=47878 RepID=A0A140GWN7_PSEAZ|nr:hypothetical protein AYR47_22205 [Pseudomonas azotoformans]
MDQQVFTAGQIVQQLLDQCQVGVVAVFVGLVHVGRMADQAPEHHPHAQQVGVHDPGRERGAEECIQARGRAFGLFHVRPEGTGQFVGQLVVGLGNQRIDAAEMVVEQPHRHPGLGSDTAHGNPRMPIARQAGEGGSNQQVPAFVGIGTAQFGQLGGHGQALDGTAQRSG